MDYDYEIVFKQGKINTNADALSRIQITSDKLKEMIPQYNVDVVTRTIKRKMKQQEQLKTVRKPLLGFIVSYIPHL